MEIGINKLKWISNGKLPGTYDEYIKNHPLCIANFSTPPEFKNVESKNISILVDDNLYQKIKNSLKQYIEDIKLEGYEAFLQTLSGGNPQEIKAWIKKQYEEGSKGIVFIGDIPAAWAEISGETFPCDIFYMDLDGNWQDKDGDGIYEVPKDITPEIYVARIYSKEGNLNDYFEKIHLYRIGRLLQNWRGMEYVDEDWYDMQIYLNLVYENVSRYDYGYYTNAKDYLEKLRKGYHFVQVCAHSYSGGHYFSTRPTESASYAHAYIYSPLETKAKLILGYDDGIKVWLNGKNVYTKDIYGGWHMSTINVFLNSGWNRLLCKISQEGRDYLLSVRVLNENFSSINGLKCQINNPDLIEEGDFIRSWLLNGFHQDSSDRFWYYLETNYLGVDEASINPQEGEEMGGKKWKRYDGNAFVDIGKYCNNANFGVCYAFARIYADSNKSCQLWLGYDDGIKVWLNGEVVLYDNRYGNFKGDMKKINVNLKAGENRLLLKISQWMGEHGFSARFCYANGSKVKGLSFDPEQKQIEYVDTWLVNGPYLNPDKETRLSKDYLGNEENVIPSENDVWKKGIGKSIFDLGNFFNNGSWVFYDDIINNDPPVLFYNLFACGAGRFTDDKCLADAYTFHTSYGLATIASSKSGSMLNFYDFYYPISQGKNIGDAFHYWLVKQSPFQQWEREWYSGMIIFGDPLLRVSYAKIDIVKPENAIYIKNRKIIPFFMPIIIGKIDIEVIATGVSKVEFYIDDKLKFTDYDKPYKWQWNEFSFGRHTIKVIGYGKNIAADEIKVWIFNW